VISHHKCAGPANWGRSTETLAYIDAARQTQSIGLDAYPYAAGSTVLRADLVDGVIDVMLAWSETHPAGFISSGKMTGTAAGNRFPFGVSTSVKMHNIFWGRRQSCCRPISRGRDR